MRTMRFIGATLVALSLSVAQGLTTRAEDGAIDAPAVVTGTESCVTVKAGVDTISMDPVVEHYRDHVSDCVDETSDARVSGTFRNTFNEDCYLMEGSHGTACSMWGTHVMTGETGGWDCTYSGVDDLWGENAGQVLVVCPGTGEYEGLTYVFQHVFGGAQDFGDGTDIHGVIYEGPPPAWGPVSMATADELGSE